MLSEKRIKEAEINVKNYLSEAPLKRNVNHMTKQIFIKNAK